MRRGEARWAEVVDYLGDPRGVTAEVVREALRLRLDFVRLRCSLPEHRAALRSPFWIAHNRPVIDDLLIYSKDARLQETLAAGRWHLTSIVSDRTDHGEVSLQERFHFGVHRPESWLANLT